MIGHPNAKQPENVMAYDNAVSALGKICQFHRESIDSTQVLNVYVESVYIVNYITVKEDVQAHLVDKCPKVGRCDSSSWLLLHLHHHWQKNCP